jgi:integrase
MAYLEKLKNGRIRVQIRGAGKPQISKTFTSKNEADAWVKYIEIEGGDSLLYNHKKNTVGDLFTRYMFKVSVNKKSGRSEIIRIMKMIREVDFMRLPLTKLSHIHLREWRDQRVTEVSDSSTRREFNTISAVINHSIKEWDVPLSLDMTKKVRRPIEHKPRSRNVSQKEIALLWENTPEIGRGVAGYVAAIFEFCCETAMRKGEALALTWDDIKTGDNGTTWAIIRESKNGTSRFVPFTSRAKEIIAKIPLKEPRVFPITSGALDPVFRELARKLGIENLHFHDSRHQATLMLSKKFSPLELAKVTGHKSLDVLLNVYYQPTGDDLAQTLASSVLEPTP